MNDVLEKYFSTNPVFTLLSIARELVKEFFKEDPGSSVKERKH